MRRVQTIPDKGVTVDFLNMVFKPYENDVTLDFCVALMPIVQQVCMLASIAFASLSTSQRSILLCYLQHMRPGHPLDLHVVGLHALVYTVQADSGRRSHTRHTPLLGQLVIHEAWLLLPALDTFNLRLMLRADI